MKRTPSTNREPILALEGLPFTIAPLAFTLITAYLGWTTLSILTLVLTLAVAAFFRNPRRLTIDDENFIVSPADGRVLPFVDTTASESDGPITEQKSRRISIFLSVLDVHINRYPCSGTIEAVTYNPGKFLAAFNDKASTDNEQQATLLRTAAGKGILIIQIAGLIARRIVCYAKEGETATRGNRMGLIRFGSRVDLWIPAEWRVLVQPGQRVRGGETLIAMSKNAES